MPDALGVENIYTLAPQGAEKESCGHWNSTEQGVPTAEGGQGPREGVSSLGEQHSSWSCHLLMNDPWKVGA